ncbi:hypothetical protein NPIL_231471 [Nephila pilipes]|uniref:Uncharacterized protein n=1 Tax=Nephila pilipes TaxID=299642 RepID=A0A8X6PG76_NEPPI|nr:hypothetical protein NPIL_231471 [Nephila pilipes]
METTATADGLLHIANCVEANLSDSLANPHQSDEATQYIIDLHEILDEVRIRYAHTREKEIALESNRLQDCLQSWGITKQPETKFTPVKGKNKSKNNTGHQAAKKPRTEEPGCSNRFSSLTIEDKEEEADMEAGEVTPMPSPTKSQKNISHPQPLPTIHKIPRRQMAPPITIDNDRPNNLCRRRDSSVSEALASTPCHTTPDHKHRRNGGYAGKAKQSIHYNNLSLQIPHKTNPTIRPQQFICQPERRPRPRRPQC